jgi:Ca2+-binding EF-hand superfamily protein
MLEKIDEDRSGVIEFDEFVKMMPDKMGERDSKEKILSAFQLFDTDGTVSIITAQLWTLKDNFVIRLGLLW